MPKISIAAAVPTKNLAATKFLHSQLGWALASASKMLLMGSSGPFYTCQLYMNDHLQHEENIRSIIDFFRSEKIELSITEIAENEEWKNIDLQRREGLVLTDIEIINALDASKGHYR